MDHAAVRAFSRQCAAYLEEKEVYDLFESLLKKVVLHQPDDPLQFMIDTLKKETKVKVLLLGPAGVSRTSFAQRLAKDHNIPCVSAGAVVKEYLTAKGDQQGLADMASGLFVPDDVAIAAVIPHLTKLDAEGWVVDGFPRTRPQALALQHAKLVPDKVLLLNCPSQTVEYAYGTKVGDGSEDMVKRRVQQFMRHLLLTVEVFKHSVMQLDIDGLSDEQVADELRHLVSLRPTSNAPLRPVRVCVLGPLGSGRTSLARRVSKHYGAVHVDVAQIVRGMKEVGAVEANVLAEDVPDAQLCAAVRERLDQLDCAHKGWVLDGFPMNRQQAQFLPNAHLMPSRVLHVTIPEDVCVKRISCRKYDPVTGIAYYGPPPSVAVRQRLKQDKTDKPEVVKGRFETHAKSVQEVETQFLRCFIPLRGDLPETEVYEKATDFIDRPLQG